MTIEDTTFAMVEVGFWHDPSKQTPLSPISITGDMLHHVAQEYRVRLTPCLLRKFMIEKKRTAAS